MPPDDESALLPEPPPPRPAARDAAVEAAMRRFDGVADQPAAESKHRVGWSHRPQFQLAIAASLILAVGLPATWIAVRNNGPLPGSVSTPAAEAPAPFDRSPAMGTSVPGPKSQPAAIPPKVTPPSATPPLQPESLATNSPAIAPMAERQPSAERDEVAATAPPPPPPPPPPAAPSLAQKSEQAAGSSVIVVTGSRIRESNLEDASAFDSLQRRAEPPNRVYERFLEELQSAVRSGDHEAVVKLVRFPLRVNAKGKSRIYRDAQSVRVDYDLIFTRRVTDAILAQRADRLFSRDQGRMIGDGEVWFDRTCANQDCSVLGPVRITAINP